MRRGHITAVYNGEVYNFPQLRRELEGQGYAFESGSDTEVVVAAFHRWGTEAFARFNGMFALAVVDDQAQRAWLARDRFGKKPLFLARLAGRTLFASELKAILAVAGRELTLDRASLGRYFGLQYVPAPYSIFAEVEKVPPASWVEIDLQDRTLSQPRRFWRLPASNSERASGDPEELLDLVRASVRRRLIADVPLGAFLSGGTDSSLVVACMRDEASDVRTFSIGFEDPRFDESSYALGVAKHLETRHTNHTLGSQDALAIVPRLATAYDEPFADSSAIPTMAVAELARRDVTVALSGDGGDELFGGYLRYRAERYLPYPSSHPPLGPDAE
jgi:asparagine synthase (glutamine-hydrolysing)